MLPNNKFTKQATNGVYLKMSEITEFSSVWIEFDSARFESYSEEVELSSEGTEFESTWAEFNFSVRLNRHKKIVCV